MARAATRQEQAGQMQALASDLVTVEGVADVFQKHIEGEDLTPTELVRLEARAYRDFRFWDNALFQYSQGLLTDDEWRGLRENLKALVQLEAYRDYWFRESTLYSTAFQNEVASILDEPLEAPRGTLMFDMQASEGKTREEDC